MDDNVVLRGEWPNGVAGLSYRRPQIVNLGVTSTLSGTLLNEARFGYHINKGSQIPPWEMSDSSVKEYAQQFLGQGGVRPAVRQSTLYSSARKAGVSSSGPPQANWYSTAARWECA